MRKVLLFSIAVLLAATFAMPSRVVAQTQFGSVSGRVADATGAVVPDAKVTLTNIATNIKSDRQTTSDGLFLFANVAAAVYDITIEKQGFRKAARRFTLDVAQRVDLDFSLQLGSITETVTVSETTAVINTVSGEVSREITSKELMTFPLLSRDPYALVALTPGAADTGTVTGDTRGLGFAVAGGRTSAVNFMLDGGENNDTFVAGLGQTVPLDAVQEFKVQTNSTTAEFGRNAITANVITKSGTNSLHGSLYEYYRGAGLATAIFDDKANRRPKTNFVRNQFGATLGGPILKDKLFYFGSFEGVRVRSVANNQFFLPTANFTANASANTNAFINAFGGLPPSNCADQAITARDIVVRIEGVPPGQDYAGNELLNSVTRAIIPAGTQLFCRGTFKVPTNAGGGAPQNTWLSTGRLDYRWSDRTSLLGRYAFAQSNFLAGSTSFSPYGGTSFNTGTDQRTQNLNLTLTHTYTPRLFSESRIIYNRLFNLQPLGAAPATTPCWQYDLFDQTAQFGRNPITFPGYVAQDCSFAGIPFGGPQNIYQFFHGMTYSRGKHAFKWGGQYLHMRDNRTFGAYENFYFDTFDMQGMLDGRVDFAFAAIDPKGKVPGDTYNPAVTGDGPYQFPSFTRHFHYNELAFYAEDSWKVTPRVTVTAGLRWEYFGILHSPENEKFLDANLYLNGVGSVPPITASKSIFEQVRDARFRRTSQFYRPDYKDFGPRVSLAWDIFGNGRTVFRAGYGWYYDRNFGNAVFNAIQNPPNYMVVSALFPNLPIRPNQFDSLTSLGQVRLESSARMLDNDLRTAYTAQWNATVEHDLFGKGVFVTVSYLGANGIRLYSLNNLNQLGSCLLAPSAPPVCNVTQRDAAGNLLPRADRNRVSRLNQTGLTGMNRRGNEGLSRYHALTTEVRSRRLGNTGLLFAGNYAWSHSIDNESSFFADSSFEGAFGFGFRDPYNPARDRASSTNDIRHRGTLSFNWEVPYAKGLTGVAGQILHGWAFSGIFVAQTGGAFSVYDRSTAGSTHCRNSGTNFCYPVLTGPVAPMTVTPQAGVPNTFTLYTLGSTFQTQQAYCLSAGIDPNPGIAAGQRMACSANLYILNPQRLSPRNMFRTPGIWNADFSVLKDFRMPWEGHKLQFRAEFFNVFNHSNLYASPRSNAFSSPTSVVIAKRGVIPGGGFDRRNIQLALRYNW